MNKTPNKHTPDARDLKQAGKNLRNASAYFVEIGQKKSCSGF